MAHLELSIPWRGSTKQPRRPTYLKFENRSRALRPDASNHWLYPIELAPSSSYPEGNFGGNQLLDGIVHHLSGPDRHALTRTLLRRSRSVGGATLEGIPPVSFLAPYGFTRPLTRTHVRLLGPCFKTGRMGSPQADARSAHCAGARRDGARCSPRSRRRRLHGRFKGPGFGRHRDPHRSTPRADRRTGRNRSTSDRGASPAPIHFPPDNFKHSLTLFFKSPFHLSLAVLVCYRSLAVFSLGRNLPPDWAAFPNNPTRRQRLVVRQGPATTGLSPSPAPLSRGLGPGPPLRTLLQTTIRTPQAPDSQAGHFPVRSPLLGESLRSRGRQARAHDRVRGSLNHRSSWRPSPRTRFWANRERERAGDQYPPPPSRAEGRGGRRCVTPRQTCPRPGGLGRNLRSKTRWFTGFCNSHQVSHFATFFIDARAEISVAESRLDYHQKKARPRRRGYGGRAPSTQFPWRFSRRGSFASRAGRRRRPSTAREDTRGGCPPSPACHATGSRVVLLGRFRQ
uniref:Uncharacterized protein n=1 Tax=Populus alba TaxID=43335 RepID=A0A4U5N7X5_POPAL|nr:hypothetical protein D5086_0000283010 [Populus alba]